MINVSDTVVETRTASSSISSIQCSYGETRIYHRSITGTLCLSMKTKRKSGLKYRLFHFHITSWYHVIAAATILLNRHLITTYMYVISSLERKLHLLRRENDAFRSSISGGSLPSHSTSPTPPSLSSYTEQCVKSLQEQNLHAQVTSYTRIQGDQSVKSHNKCWYQSSRIQDDQDNNVYTTERLTDSHENRNS